MTTRRATGLAKMKEQPAKIKKNWIFWHFQVNETTFTLFLCGNLASVIDKHAPFRTKRVKNKCSPWITNELLHEIHKRDFPKKKATSTIIDPLIWKKFKDSRNKANNSMKNAKRKYFSENLDANKSDPHKTYH